MGTGRQRGADGGGGGGGRRGTCLENCCATIRSSEVNAYHFTSKPGRRGAAVREGGKVLGGSGDTLAALGGLEAVADHSLRHLCSLMTGKKA